MPDLEQLLKSAPIPDSVRADAWDAYHAAAGPQDLAARLGKLPIDNETKATLWDAKNTATPPVDMRPKNVGTTPDEPAESQGMLRSFYEGAIRPVVDQVADTYKRGDFGAKAAGELLSSFKDQVRNFAGHPDVRNLPIVGPGATATAAKMQKQFDAGNYQGMVGTAAGFVAPFATPALKDAAPDAAAALKRGAQKVSNWLPESLPTIPAGAIDAAGMVAPHIGFVGRTINRGVNLINKVLPEKTASSAALTPGEQILADMRASTASKAREDAAYDSMPGTPADQTPNVQALQKAAETGNRGAAEFYAKKVEAEQPAQAPQSPPFSEWWPKLQAELAADRDAAKAAGTAPPPAPRVPLWKGIEATPRDPAAPVEPIPSALPSGRVAGPRVQPGASDVAIDVAPDAPGAPQPVAEPTDLEKQLQASLDRHPKADENRVQAADRWAQNLKQLNVPAPAPGDDAAWANLSRSLGERAGYVPAPDTRQMIRERLAATPPTAQTLLDKSKAAFDAARARRTKTP